MYFSLNYSDTKPLSAQFLPLRYHRYHWKVPAHHCPSPTMSCHCWPTTAHSTMPLHTPPFSAPRPPSWPCQPTTTTFPANHHHLLDLAVPPSFAIHHSASNL